MKYLDVGYEHGCPVEGKVDLGSIFTQVCSSHVAHIVVMIVSRDSYPKACIESLRLSMNQGLDSFWTNGLFFGSCLANDIKQILMTLGGKNV
jgi:hypothetical protein